MRLLGKVLKPTLNRLVLLVVDIIHLACPQMNISGVQQRPTNIPTALRNVRAVFADIPALGFHKYLFSQIDKMLVGNLEHSASGYQLKDRHVG